MYMCVHVYMCISGTYMYVGEFEDWHYFVLCVCVC